MSVKSNAGSSQCVGMVAMFHADGGRYCALEIHADDAESLSVLERMRRKAELPTIASHGCFEKHQKQQAVSKFNELLEARKLSGFEDVKLDSLKKIYELMQSTKMGALGLDLFLDTGFAYISMADYLKLLGYTNNSANNFSFVHAHTNLRLASLATYDNAQDRQFRMATYGLKSTTQLLREKKLDRLGLFVGHIKTGQICRGLQPLPSSASQTSPANP